jgi:hypothetical protein
MRTFLRRLILTVAVTTLITAIWWFWYTHRNYKAIFANRAGSFVAVERTFVSESNGVRLYDLVIVSNTGLRTQGRISVPARLDPPSLPADRKVPAILLAAGLHTGKQSIDHIPSRSDMVVMAIDYGWTGEFDISTLSNMKRVLSQLRATTMDAVPRALLALDLLSSEQSVNTNQIAVVGVSYGSYVAIPAAAIHPVVDELILVQGGAEIGPTIASNAARWNMPLPAFMAGWLGNVLFVPFDPHRWMSRLDQRRLTMIASRDDNQMPTDALTRVFNAAPGSSNQFVWIDAPHVAPDAVDIISLLSSNIVQHLDKTYELPATP